MTRELVESALEDTERLRQKLTAILDSMEMEKKDARPAAAKHANGRLSEAGVTRLRAMIDAGFRDSEIARTFDITQPAVIHQRQKYLGEKRPTR
jgi:hypothetical protein